MPFVSTSQEGWMWANKPAMARRWQKHTPKGAKLPEHVEKKAYDMGAERALLELGFDVKQAGESVGQETRLRKDHKPHSYYLVNRSFERAGTHKKEVGTHEPKK